MTGEKKCSSCPFSLCSSRQERLKHFCFLIFMGVLFTSGIIIHLFLPETKGKSIVEITEEFHKLNFKKKPIPPATKHIAEDYTFCTRLWLLLRRSEALLKGRNKGLCHFLTSESVQTGCQLSHLSLARLPLCQSSTFPKRSTLGRLDEGQWLTLTGQTPVNRQRLGLTCWCVKLFLTEQLIHTETTCRIYRHSADYKGQNCDLLSLWFQSVFLQL